MRVKALLVSLLVLIFLGLPVFSAFAVQTGTNQPAKLVSVGSKNNFIKQKFIEGGPVYMSLVLITFIVGLVFSIERILYLNLCDVNSNALLQKVETLLSHKQISEAKALCQNTPGPAATVIYQGLLRSEEGLDIAEKSMAAYGSIEAGLLEKGLPWISLCIALAPMLGFLGTVIGMIESFDAIALVGDISPSLVAGGIKVALITTVGGLIAAIVLQIFYNYCTTKINKIINDMEASSVVIVDLLMHYKVHQK